MEENTNINIDLSNATEEELQEAQTQINNQLEFLTNKRVEWEIIGEKLIDYCKTYGSFKAIKEEISLDFIYKEEEGFKYSPDFSTVGVICQSKSVIEIEEDIIEEDSNESTETTEENNIEQINEFFETSEDISSEDGE